MQLLPAWGEINIVFQQERNEALRLERGAFQQPLQDRKREPHSEAPSPGEAAPATPGPSASPKRGRAGPPKAQL